MIFKILFLGLVGFAFVAAKPLEKNKSENKRDLLGLGGGALFGGEKQEGATSKPEEVQAGGGLFGGLLGGGNQNVANQSGVGGNNDGSSNSGGGLFGGGGGLLGGVLAGTQGNKGIFDLGGSIFGVKSGGDFDMLKLPGEIIKTMIEKLKGAAELVSVAITGGIPGLIGYFAKHAIGGAEKLVGGAFKMLG